MASILIVDDEMELRSALKALLEKHGHKIAEAADGEEARQVVSVVDFDLVISDIQMPGLSGVDLLKWIKRHKPAPVVLITAFAHLMETQLAFELGADDFLTKPFKNDEVLSSVSTILGTSPVADDEDQDDRFCRLPLEEFVSGSHLAIPIYVRLSSKKYVRVAHMGDNVPPNRVETFKNRGLHYLYVEKGDFAKVVGFNLELLRAVSENDVIPPSKKASFLRYTTETILEQVYVNGVDRKSFDQARQSVDLMLSLVTESDMIYELLEILNAHANWLYAHGLGVSVYSSMIGRAMGWTSSTTLFKLGLAGLLHDVGKKEISTEVLEKPRALMSQEERKLYETHPVRSKDILSSLEGFPADVIQVAFEHHESHLGGGYPRAIPSFRIHPFAKVVNVADRFCYFALKSPHSPGYGAKEGLLNLASYAQEVDPAVLKAFRKCLVGEA